MTGVALLPGANLLGGALPGGALPGGGLPGGGLPGNALEGFALLGGGMPGCALKGGGLPGRTMPGGAFMGGAFSEQALSDGNAPETASARAFSEQVPSEGNAPETTPPPDAISGSALATAAAPRATPRNPPLPDKPLPRRMWQATKQIANEKIVISQQRNLARRRTCDTMRWRSNDKKTEALRFSGETPERGGKAGAGGAKARGGGEGALNAGSCVWEDATQSVGLSESPMLHWPAHPHCLAHSLFGAGPAWV